MVGDAPDRQRLESVLAGNASHEGPQPFFQFGRDYRLAFLGAPGAMKVAINLLDRIVWTALTQRPRLGSRYRVDRSAWSWPAGSDLGGRGEPMRPGIF